MEAFIPRKKDCLLDCLDWVPNRGTCIDACFGWWRDTLLSSSCYKALCSIYLPQSQLLKSLQKCR